jgi:hypothetical protein
MCTLAKAFACETGLDAAPGMQEVPATVPHALCRKMNICYWCGDVSLAAGHAGDMGRPHLGGLPMGGRTMAGLLINNTLPLPVWAASRIMKDNMVLPGAEPARSARSGRSGHYWRTVPLGNDERTGQERHVSAVNLVRASPGANCANCAGQQFAEDSIMEEKRHTGMNRWEMERVSMVQHQLSRLHPRVGNGISRIAF